MTGNGWVLDACISASGLQARPDAYVQQHPGFSSSTCFTKVNLYKNGTYQNTQVTSCNLGRKVGIPLSGKAKYYTNFQLVINNQIYLAVNSPTLTVS